ncbi:MAG: mannosyl-glycoprotein endo-beta-N-acetylglucosamidase [Epsilonproteobacteria bacterium]|nr:mannosyl-glycoprotein endo-beta-N-acetylglucosamidase [Campylobacterota bacterium]
MRKWFLFICLATALFAAEAVKSFPKSYYQIKDQKRQKEMFVKTLYPLIVNAEEKIKRERAFVIRFFDKLSRGEIVTPGEQNALKALAKKYRIKKLYDKEAYLTKVDTIPVSLVLAQAAVESNWGRSRFAREANNLFGEWTWGKKGLIPKNREEGKTHKIRIFDSLEASIASYMRNLNRHWAYKEFRAARYAARKSGKRFDGLVAAGYLTRYSELKEKYTAMLKSTIARNDFNLYDTREIKAPAPGGEMAFLSEPLTNRLLKDPRL